MKKWIIASALVAIGMSVWAEDTNAFTTTTFKAMDTNRDGKVTRSEFISYRKERAKKARKPFDSKAAEKEFKKKDKDKNNALSREEFLAPVDEKK